ncbi:MAG TPA: MBL fold metallo-hydrolase, partial [Thermodesulfobacteriota bacterium]|nr:MBL fold metallo-hydrolase [Thermodesulfobacteriota bacterium]
MASVRIRWFGHSGFSIRDGKTALIDPWFEGNPKAPGGVNASPGADLLLLTHDHFD